MKNSSLPSQSIYRIRYARSDEVTDLQQIDLKSCELFEGTGLIDFGPNIKRAPLIPEENLRRGLGDRLLWVATDIKDTPIGFALCSHKPGSLYLDQVSVLPQYGQRGIGRELVNKTIQAAREHNYKSLSLSTFRDVAWNGKFYRGLGFKEIPRKKLTPWQLELEQLQTATMDISKRCFMHKSVKRLFF
ncbi:GNAT family N-acetyltransferase [Hirschia baltica]|uniref:GCN5-related N-acetyltransferase n=1 Tax=Hirschia baltica (strain ATCC 49814 / DSM 5838 / IFAM 1418) TaxID=582402 RepID=C6XIW3_HIRBI|nr:GNAT family N-acetyltransferase [Hirschia baltica]ACT59058.1 GCN5-related N-acetyltransferase [Hirschia baltica ATCC 49814]